MNCKMCNTELTWENKCFCLKCKESICETCFEENGGKCSSCLPKKEELIIDKIRRSHIEEYRICPYKFKLEVVDGLETAPHPLAQLGIDLHDIYEKVQVNELSVEEIDFEIMQIIDSYEYDDAQKEDMRIRAKTCNDNFKIWLDTLDTEMVCTEERIDFEIGKDLPKATIAYDRLGKDAQGNLHIYDFKTGKAMSGKKLTTDLQPALYLYAVKTKYGVMPETFRLIYLSDTYKDGTYKEKVFHKKNDNEYVCYVGKKEYVQNISEQIKEVQKIFGRIKSRKFQVPEKNIGYHCDICHFKKTGKCAGQLEQGFVNANGKNFKW